MKWLGYRWLLCILCTFALTLTACGSEQSSSSQGGGYKETKTMLLDILKSDEGKKAIYEAISSGSSSSSSSSDSGGGSSGGGGTVGVKMILPSQTNDEVRLAVKDTITSPEYKKEIEKIMTEPKFAGDFAKAINSESKQLHLQLIKDPTYQKSVGEIMKSPEMMKMFLDLTKTSDYRKQSMSVVQETMQSPLFKMEIMEILKAVVKEQLEPKITDSKSGGEGGSGESGGSGGDSGGGDSGSGSGSGGSS
ncbi:spore germination protein D [Paenibacillus anaericanus]|uniref:spore germination lipoprotein GerD n=1 Tax=Paenibacillus anaericanus TaxID=170367 RepID=UPI002783D77F|nr:spore germination lipoprotein GerD [Paenibacillus anaericanus]MDQ0091856.1 spore germination protein D [Paenibacillus anaericanus]